MKTYKQIVKQPVRVNWEGSLFVHHSLGMVNRELLSELIKDNRLETGHVAYEPDQFIPELSSKYNGLLHIHNKKVEDANVHIRHRWPPDFSKPDADKFILMQPWEYGSLPVEWVNNINEYVDEVWVYTTYLKMCYIRSGIPEEKVQVVPCGIDPMQFNPEQKPSDWVNSVAAGRFCFLFNGGTTLRKGIDILINAYLSEFKSHEPVCMIIKDSQMYEKGIASKIKELARRNDVAHIVYTDQNFSHEELAGLYSACDCYVHPYRAEGFGLPIAEAMACGKPVIVTGAGSCLDFVEPDTGFFIKCSPEKMKDRNVSGMPTVDKPFWMVPDMNHLQSVMRYVYRNYYIAKEKGALAGERIRAEHTWRHAAARASERIIAVATGNSDCLQQLLGIADNYMLVGDIENAELSFEKILGLYGDNGIAFEGLAVIAFQQKRYEESFDFFRKANLLMPGVSSILLNWYETAKQIGKSDDIVKPLLRALEISKNDDELSKLAVSLNASG